MKQLGKKIYFFIIKHYLAFIFDVELLFDFLIYDYQ